LFYHGGLRWTAYAFLLFQPLMNLCLKLEGAGLVFCLGDIAAYLVSFVSGTGLSGLFADFYQAVRWFLARMPRCSPHAVSVCRR